MDTIFNFLNDEMASMQERVNGYDLIGTALLLGLMHQEVRRMLYSAELHNLVNRTDFNAMSQRLRTSPEELKKRALAAIPGTAERMSAMTPVKLHPGSGSASTDASSTDASAVARSTFKGTDSFTTFMLHNLLRRIMRDAHQLRSNGKSIGNEGSHVILYLNDIMNTTNELMRLHKCTYDVSRSGGNPHSELVSVAADLVQATKHIRKLQTEGILDNCNVIKFGIKQLYHAAVRVEGSYK
tara:strand:- start:13270 stop:13989 length:720 start_codon:yes stop_codon:yes gene_type:complete